MNIIQKYKLYKEIFKLQDIHEFVQDDDGAGFFINDYRGLYLYSICEISPKTDMKDVYRLNICNNSGKLKNSPKNYNAKGWYAQLIYERFMEDYEKRTSHNNAFNISR